MNAQEKPDLCFATVFAKTAKYLILILQQLMLKKILTLVTKKPPMSLAKT
jgi:hypothetical protein